MAFNDDGSVAVSFGGGAACAAGFKCVQTSCLFCQCGLSVSVTANGTTVSFGGSSGAWSFTRTGNVTCPLCPQDTGGGGGGGGGVGGCSAGVAETATTSIAMSDLEQLANASSSAPRPARFLHSSFGGPGVDYTLRRVEKRGGESFIMDEWAIVSGGTVVATSDPAFGRAVIEQGGAGGGDMRLVVQKPVHVRNARWVQEPGILVIGDGTLPRPLRGTGAVVTARLEFARNGRIDSAEILSSTVPIAEGVLESLLRRSVQLGFGDDGESHRAAAYVVVELTTDGLQLRNAVSALPQCCCGTDEPFCI